MKDVLIMGGTVLLILVAMLSFLYLTPRHSTHPVACADIPESNERIIIVRDGQVECHYKITKVRERK